MLHGVCPRKSSPELVDTKQTPVARAYANGCCVGWEEDPGTMGIQTREAYHADEKLHPGVGGVGRT